MNTMTTVSIKQMKHIPLWLNNSIGASLEAKSIASLDIIIDLYMILCPLYCQFQLLSNQKKKKEKKLDALCAYDLPLSNIKKRRKMQDLDVNNARCLSLSLYKKRDIYTFGINDWTERKNLLAYIAFELFS